MKTIVHDLVEAALKSLQSQQVLPAELNYDIQVERTRDPSHGDYACNIALMLAKKVSMNPRELAGKVVAELPQAAQVKSVDIAGPGFINFFLSQQASLSVVAQVLEQGVQYGHASIGSNKSVQVEFVSANPTGPLHVGHGRGAAYGAALSNLLQVAGYQVHKEYYVNDAGRQMDILATSVWMRYLELCGEAVDFPVAGYKGDYVWDVAADVHREYSEKFRFAPTRVFEDLPADDTPDGMGDKEAHIDALIERSKELLGSDFNIMHNAALTAILGDIRQDLEEFGVTYDEWFSERALVESGAVSRAIQNLKQAGHVYDKDGKLWFASSNFGDEKDRVVIRENGIPTYLASDIAYHLNKLERDYDQIIDIWGADHHGYVARIKAVLQAQNHDPAKLEVLLVQFAVLYRGKEKVQMSTRSGQFVTLRELRREVGNDAARFFYVMRKCEQHMDFDLDLAKSQSNENPVYYIQYAHARVCTVMQRLQEKGYSYDQAQGLEQLANLNESHESALLSSLSRYPEVIESAARNHEPHQVAHYLRELANDFHTYYNAHQFIVDDASVRNARLVLIQATRQVIANGLAILGVSAPESM